MDESGQVIATSRNATVVRFRENALSTPLRQRMLEDMRLRGLSEATQKRYVNAVCRLARYYNKSPTDITDEELRQYFLYLKDEKQLSRSACTVVICAIKFLFTYSLNREWPVLERVRPIPVKKQPEILSRERSTDSRPTKTNGRVLQERYRLCITQPCVFGHLLLVDQHWLLHEYS